MDPSVLVLGLGNPGAAYRATRHNLGFRVVERLAALAGVVLEGDAAAGELAMTARVEIAGHPVLLAQPLTYMNRAGRAADELWRRHGIPVTEWTLVYDDADLELGRVRVRRGGGAGGHNGVRSVIEVLGRADFVRVRLGVRGPDRDLGDLADYVLSEFDATELPTAERLCAVGGDVIESLLREGLAATMNRFNGARIAGGGDPATVE